MKFENTEVWGFEHAIRGMRNPKESWDRSDSGFKHYIDGITGEEIVNSTEYVIGKKDLELMQTLIKAGSEHRKFMRQIFVSCDITAPIYWFKEFDTYRIGVTENSTSTMHKLASTPITEDCFECSDLICKDIVCLLEGWRQTYNDTKDKKYWKKLIVNLPESWLQTRTVTMNYENLLSMYRQRQNHKLTEWHSFCEWVESLPYAQELIIL